MGEIKQIFFIYTFFHELTYSQTRRWIFTLAGSNDADARKGVPFGGFVDTAPHFEGEISPQPLTQFWGVNRRFQVKRANIESFMLSKPLHRFQANFAQR